VNKKSTEEGYRQRMFVEKNAASNEHRIGLPGMAEISNKTPSRGKLPAFESRLKIQNLVSINVLDVIESLGASSSCTGSGISMTN